jgi:hypothetical protein
MIASEVQIQSACYQWLWNTYPTTRRCFFHVPNGGTRNRIEANQLKASGVVAGIPDCVLVWKGSAYGFEFKTATGQLSPAQKEVHYAWKGQGVQVEVIRSFEQFREVIDGIINRPKSHIDL